MRTLRTLGTTTSSKFTTPSTTTTKPTFSTPAIVPKSLWHSPLPYLFGGLAAMLGLIAFALLLLACSYWRLSSSINNQESTGERDSEEGGDDGKAENAAAGKAMPGFEEKIVVIMAGDVKPTFLATPVSSKASCFGDGFKKNENFGKEKEEIVERPKHEVSDHNEQTVRSAEDGNQSRESTAAQESPGENQP
ncbi:protein GLUTAMINE DUMPER 2-like [Coffea eugenioides]|uniref:protein GLUTAMINE DUMPER 2-like n=1 Tax=Coffea eugenioides TaxID=49369 RepID=UPI000F6153CC|nr:protein GLUTAMINE DUMPER 2-like [Coffea eugenioides]